MWPGRSIHIAERLLKLTVLRPPWLAVLAAFTGPKGSFRGNFSFIFAFFPPSLLSFVSASLPALAEDASPSVASRSVSPLSLSPF
jgi:hypothetical protein